MMIRLVCVCVWWGGSRECGPWISDITDMCITSTSWVKITWVKVTCYLSDRQWVQPDGLLNFDINFDAVVYMYYEGCPLILRCGRVLISLWTTLSVPRAKSLHSTDLDRLGAHTLKGVFIAQVELRMRKCEVLHWETLERKGEAPKLKLPQSVASYSTKQTEQVAHKYPSSSHYTRDWDKLVADVKQEEKDEKPEGDAALNQLFQQIYQGGSDEVKKAMNKSFVSCDSLIKWIAWWSRDLFQMESGGTVLSTNWGEIGKDKVDCKPPDGMEWKKYEK